MISTIGDIDYPPRTPDLNPMDFPCGHISNQEYTTTNIRRNIFFSVLRMFTSYVKDLHNAFIATVSHSQNFPIINFTKRLPKIKHFTTCVIGPPTLSYPLARFPRFCAPQMAFLRCRKPPAIISKCISAPASCPNEISHWSPMSERRYSF